MCASSSLSEPVAILAQAPHGLRSSPVIFFFVWVFHAFAGLTDSAATHPDVWLGEACIKGLATLNSWPGLGKDQQPGANRRNC